MPCVAGADMTVKWGNRQLPCVSGHAARGKLAGYIYVASTIAVTVVPCPTGREGQFVTRLTSREFQYSTTTARLHQVAVLAGSSITSKTR